MDKLGGFARFVLGVSVSWFVLGSLGMLAGLGFATLTGNGPAVWAVFGLAIIIAFLTALFAPRLLASLPGPVWLTRVALTCVPLFFCGYMLVSGTPDWDPRPLLVGWALSAVASVIVWRRTREVVHESLTAVA